MTARPLEVLFLCTGNSARSVMAESLLNQLGRGRFRAHSAGSHPTGRVNPFTLELLGRRGHPVGQLRSKSWDEFAAPGAPKMDFIFTVCDQAAGETCPVWPGQPATAHWGFEDPAAGTGSDEDQRRLFEKVYGQIAARIEAFVALPVERMGRGELERTLRGMGKGESSGQGRVQR